MHNVMSPAIERRQGYVTNQQLSVTGSVRIGYIAAL